MNLFHNFLLSFNYLKELREVIWINILHIDKNWILRWIVKEMKYVDLEDI